MNSSGYSAHSSLPLESIPVVMIMRLSSSFKGHRAPSSRETATAFQMVQAVGPPPKRNPCRGGTDETHSWIQGTSSEIMSYLSAKERTWYKASRVAIFEGTILKRPCTMSKRIAAGVPESSGSSTTSANDGQDVVNCTQTTGHAMIRNEERLGQTDQRAPVCEAVDVSACSSLGVPSCVRNTIPNRRWKLLLRKTAIFFQLEGATILLPGSTRTFSQPGNLQLESAPGQGFFARRLMDASLHGFFGGDAMESSAITW